MRADVEIQMPAGGTKSTVRLNGQDIAGCLGGFDLLGRPGPDTTLTLHIVAPEVTVKGEMQVLLSDQTRALLLGLGWTPPA
jgi:hypothetical protein